MQFLPILLLLSLMGGEPQPARLAALDDYARNAPVRYEKDVPTLAAYLAAGAKNDTEKARILFTWVATHIDYDDAAYNDDQVSESEAEEVLRRKFALCGGYSNLFKALGNAMGLEVEVVEGYSKGYGYWAGDEFTDTNHSWNVVRLDGEWRPFDATWGSGHGKNRNGNLVHITEFEPYWFNTDPAAFVLTHLPEDPQWQLIADPLTKEEYEAMPRVGKDYFKFGFGGEALLSAARDGEAEFVEIYDVPFGIKAVQLPFTENIARAPVTFVVDSDELIEVVCIEGNKSIPFKRSGNRFTLTHTPTTSTVTLSGRVRGWVYHTIVKYSVGS